MKRKLCLLFCLLFLLTSCTGAPPASDEPKSRETAFGTPLPENEEFRYEGNGFDSPEAAVLYFLEGLKKLDFEQMLAAYAWETRIEHFSAEELLRYNRTFIEGAAWLPGSSDIIRSLNLETMRAQEATLIYRSILLNLLPEEKRSGQFNPAILDSGEAVNEYMSQFDREKLEDLREMNHIRFLTVTDVAGDLITERRMKRIKTEAAIYGVNEFVILPAIADVGDEKLIFAPTVARYGDRWYIFSPDSIVMNHFHQEYSYPNGAFMTVSKLPFSDLLARDAKEAGQKEAVPRKIRYEGEGFNTPEEAAVSYLEGLKNLDLDQMLKAFAWETAAEHYDPPKAAELNLYPLYSWIMPMINPFVEQAEMHVLRADQLRYIYQSLQYYLLPDDFYRRNDRDKRAYVIGRLKDEELDELIQYFANTESEKLEKLTRTAHIRFISPDDIVGGEIWQEVSQARAEYFKTLYGADEIRFLTAIADIDDQHLYFAPTSIRYGNKWYLVQTNNPVYICLENITAEFRLFGQGFACGPLFPLQ